MLLCGKPGNAVCVLSWRMSEKGAPMIRLIALDLDNTLLMTDNSIPDEVCEALAGATEKGVEVVIASGRVFPISLRYARQIGSTAPVIAYNGGIVESQEGKILFSRTVPEESRRGMAEFCREQDLYLQLYDPLDGDKICVAKRRPEILGEQYQLPASFYREYGDLRLADVATPKMVIYGETDRLEEALPLMRSRFGKELDFAFSDKRVLEIMPQGVNKGSTLEHYCKSRGLNPQEVMACGDNLNDLSMLQYAGTAVAVANAVEEIRGAANYVASAERSWGVLEAVRRFVL